MAKKVRGLGGEEVVRTKKELEELKKKCYEMYLEGNTIREISAVLKISMGTIHVWHLRFKWSAKKELLQQAYEQTFFDRTIENAQVIVDRILSTNIMAADLAQRAMHNLFTNRAPGAVLEGDYEQRRRFRAELRDLVKINSTIAYTFKLTLPTADEDLTKKVINILQEKHGKLLDIEKQLCLDVQNDAVQADEEDEQDNTDAELLQENGDTVILPPEKEEDNDGKMYEQGDN